MGLTYHNDSCVKPCIKVVFSTYSSSTNCDPVGLTYHNDSCVKPYIEVVLSILFEHALWPHALAYSLSSNDWHDFMWNSAFLCSNDIFECQIILSIFFELALLFGDLGLLFPFHWLWHQSTCRLEIFCSDDSCVKTVEIFMGIFLTFFHLQWICHNYTCTETWWPWPYWQLPKNLISSSCKLMYSNTN